MVSVLIRNACSAVESMFAKQHPGAWVQMWGPFGCLAIGDSSSFFRIGAEQTVISTDLPVTCCCWQVTCLTSPPLIFCGRLPVVSHIQQTRLAESSCTYYTTPVQSCIGLQQACTFFNKTQRGEKSSLCSVLTGTAVDSFQGAGAESGDTWSHTGRHPGHCNRRLPSGIYLMLLRLPSAQHQQDTSPM